MILCKGVILKDCILYEFFFNDYTNSSIDHELRFSSSQNDITITIQY